MRDYPTLHPDKNVKAHERLSNITPRQKLK